MKEIKDHKGTEYETIELMCKAWGVSVEDFKYRTDRGWRIQEALTGVKDVDRLPDGRPKPRLNPQDEDLEEKLSDWARRYIEKQKYYGR